MGHAGQHIAFLFLLGTEPRPLDFIAYLALFQQASSASSCGVPWTLLAAVAHTESDFDPSVISSAGAEGLFQFELGTFAAYDRPTPTSGAVPPSPFDPTDSRNGFVSLSLATPDVDTQ